MRVYFSKKHTSTCGMEFRNKSGISPCLITLLICLTLSLGGCTQKDIEFPEEVCKLEIQFLWDNAPSASPEGMTLLFYPFEKRGEFWRFEISGRNGGFVEIPRGTYTMIAVNNDLPGIVLTDLPYESANLKVREVPRSLTYASPAGIVYEGRIDKLTVSSQGVEYLSEEGFTKGNEIPEIACYPDSVSTLCHLVVDSIDGMDKVKSASAVIEGFASGVLLSSLAPEGPEVAVPFNLETDVENIRFAGSTTGFLSNPATASYMLTLRVVYNSGGAYEKSFDVTGQVINHLYPHNVKIIIRGLTLPEEPTIQPDEVGIKVNVDGWKVIDIDIDSTDY